ncbi:hypothetical protein Nepgr_017256 [Nepenthes gracilis]|uniref:BUB1 N-terminal domain-containing protein n=1 Tax=Nepenthes gracilis TaxID=150966 RepID=A0AAD3SR43_NEPGR|nr:hypothetical protein Nepgr_017256 [Nepenthes gracilis]
MASTLQSDLFSSVISDIRIYSGNDPLLPWIRGVRKMRETLTPKVLHEKLPRFLQKCAQTFQSDRRYQNDPRFVRIWLHLMDYVDDPRAVLRTMEREGIGTKRSLFYQAYALYYEKMKKFEDAEKMYRLGAQNLAEPLNELQKSYEQFLQRMVRHRKKKIQDAVEITAKRPLSEWSISQHSCSSRGNNVNSCKVDSGAVASCTKESLPVINPKNLTIGSEKILGKSYESQIPLHETECPGALQIFSNGISGDPSTTKQVMDHNSNQSQLKEPGDLETKLDEPSMLQRVDSVILKFVDTAIVGKSEAEDACHHGLVDPTINTKEAMNAINNMFREPLELTFVGRPPRCQPKASQNPSSGFEVFIDENMDNVVISADPRELSHTKMSCPLPQPIDVFIDDDGHNEVQVKTNYKIDLEPSEFHESTEGYPLSSPQVYDSMFLRPKDHQLESSGDLNIEPSKANIQEDTVVCRFVASAISDEPEVENICHHGLVDPTVNLREAMDDINSMFGKPIDFVRTTRKKKQGLTAPLGKSHQGGFSILNDDDLVCQQGQLLPSSSGREDRCDLLEPTVFTKEAMDDINKMFAMPFNF